MLLIQLLPIALIIFVIVAAMIILPFVSFWPFSDFLAKVAPLAEFNIKLVIEFLLAILLLFLWQIIFVQIAHYYLDTWIVTDQRTVHTELLGLFNRSLSSVYHHRIQDVSVDVKGILQTFFEYGNVQIQTAGQFREFIFKDIPEPYKTKDTITQAQLDFFRKMKEKSVSFEDIDETTEGLISDDSTT